MYKRSSELGADDKIDARNKQGNCVVETGRFQDISGRNGLINRLINSNLTESFYGGNLSVIKSFDFPNFRALLSTDTTQRFLYKINASFFFDQYMPFNPLTAE